MPPKAFFRKAIRAGVAFNYRLIKNLDIFGVNLAAYCNTSNISIHVSIKRKIEGILKLVL